MTRTSWAYIPPWLDALMGERERAIMTHPYVRALHMDRDGNRLPNDQMLLETPDGDSFLICATTQRIIG